MKFQKLEIMNIASLEDAVVDFNKDPLASENLFLIWGETGSGKSTLLDAICLALYDDTPRLCNVAVESYSDELLNVRGKDGMVTIGNPLQLVRRNTAEAYAKLTFEGNDGKIYRASWIAFRGKKKKLDTVLEKTRILEKINAQGVFEELNPKEIKSYIESADVVGMSMAQFMRTAILAQGEYDKFINGRCDEKCEILEKLTNTENFTKYGKAIFSRYSSENATLETLKVQMGAVKLLSTEERTAFETEKSGKESRMKEIEAEVKRYGGYITWLEKHISLSKSVTETKAALDELAKKEEKDEYKSSKEILRQWDETETARADYKGMKEAEVEEQRLKDELKNKEKDFTSLCGGILYEKNEKVELEKKKTELQDVIDNQKEFADIYENAGAIVTVLRNYAETLDNIKQTDADLQTKKAVIPSLEKDWQSAVTDRDEKKAKVDAKQKEIDDQNALLENYNENEINAEKDALERAKEALMDVNSTQKEINGKQKELDAAKALVDELNAKIPGLLKAKEDADADAKKAREEYDKVSLSAQDAVKGIKSRLKKGDVCPVCGSKIIEIVKDSVFDAMIKKAEKIKDDADVTAKSAGELYADENGKLDAQKGVKQQCSDAIESLNKELKKQMASADEHLKQLGLKAAQPDVKDVFEGMIKRNNAQIKAISEIRKEIQKLATEKTPLDNALNEAVSNESECRQKLTEAEAEVKTYETALGTYNRKKQQQEKELDETLGDKIAWRDASATDAADKLDTKSKQYAADKKELDSLTNVKILNLTASIGRLNSIKSKVMECTGWSADDIKAAKFDDLEKKWGKLQSDVTTTKSSIDTYKNLNQQKRKALNDFYEVMPEYKDESVKALIDKSAGIGGMRTMVDTIEQAYSKAEGAYGSSKKNFEDHQSSVPDDFKVEEYVEESEDDKYVSAKQAISQKIVDSNSEADTIKGRLGEIKAQLDTDDENVKNVGSLQKRIDDQTKVVSDWKTLNSIFGDANGKTFRNIVQALVMKQLLSNSNKYLSQITKRYTLDVDYNNLVITCTDNLQGGEKRSVSTLSGGERFMTSLAIALGLSSLSNNKFTPDILFIDEGFGTLSPEWLDAVMNTLKGVQATTGGRHIGMISHVEALKSEIPVHIAITRIKDGLSKLEVEVSA